MSGTGSHSQRISDSLFKQPIQTANFNQPSLSTTHASSPVLFGEAPGRPVFPLSPLKDEGDGAPKGRNHCSLCARIPSRKYGAPLGAPPRQACAVRAYLRRLPSCAGPRFSWSPQTGTASVSQLLAGGPYWPPGGAPAPPGCVLCEARPRAPHPAPPPDAS
jgi:hypothetical protein